MPRHHLDLQQLLDPFVKHPLDRLAPPADSAYKLNHAAHLIPAASVQPRQQQQLEQSSAVAEEAQFAWFEVQMHSCVLVLPLKNRLN